MSAVHHVDIRDGSLLQLTLGLVASLRQLDALVATYAPPHDRPLEADDATARTLDLVLGVIAIRNRIAAELAACSSAPEERAAEPQPESWLR